MNPIHTLLTYFFIISWILPSPKYTSGSNTPRPVFGGSTIQILAGTPAILTYVLWFTCHPGKCWHGTSIKPWTGSFQTRPFHHSSFLHNIWHSTVRYTEGCQKKKVFFHFLAFKLKSCTHFSSSHACYLSYSTIRIPNTTKGGKVSVHLSLIWIIYRWPQHTTVNIF
jgi:hypothetical protein